MSAAVADTHTIVWYLSRSPELSVGALAAIDAAAAAGAPIYIPSISLVELQYLSERGRIPPDAMDRLRRTLDEPRPLLHLAPLTRAVADAVALVPRAAVPDMPDRIIAATALALDLPLITRDTRIRASTVRTIW